MWLIRALKWFFLPEEGKKSPPRLREVSDNELLGRLKRGMPLEHITCDEYVPVPRDKFHFREAKKEVRVKFPKQKPKENKREAEEFIEKGYKMQEGERIENGYYRTGSYEAQVEADNHKSGYNFNTSSVEVHPSYSSGFTPSLLKEAIEDAKAVRETARINAQIAMDEAFKNNRKYVLENKVNPIILPIKKDKISGLEIDEFDLNKIFAQRRVKVYDGENW